MAEKTESATKKGFTFLARHGDRECSFNPPTQRKIEIEGELKGGTLGFFQNMEGFRPRGRHNECGAGWGRGGRWIEECGYEGHVTGMEGCPDKVG